MSKFVKDSFWTVSRLVLNLFIGIGITILIARSFGPKGQGMYNLYLIFPKTLHKFLFFGSTGAFIYFFGKMKDKRADIIKSNFYLYNFLGIMAVIVGFAYMTFFPREKIFDDLSDKYMYLMLAALPPMFFSSFQNAIFRAKEEFFVSNLFNFWQYFWHFTLTIIAILVFGLKLEYILAAFVLSYYIYVLIGIRYIRRLKIKIFDGVANVKIMTKSVRFGLETYVSGVAGYLNRRLDVFLLSYFADIKQVGLYMVAVNVAERVWLISDGFSQVLFSKLANMEDELEKSRFAAAVSRSVFMMAMLAGIVLYFLVDFIVHFFFGEAFASSILIFKWLLPGVVMGTVARIISPAITAKGKPIYNTYVGLVMMVINAIISYYLISMHFAIGAAIATSIVYAINVMIKGAIFVRIGNISFKDLFLIGEEDLEVYRLLKIKIFKKLGKNI
jgi:O-antigen/teichoic acid export membrane protein